MDGLAANIRGSDSQRKPAPGTVIRSCHTWDRESASPTAVGKDGVRGADGGRAGLMGGARLDEMRNLRIVPPCNSPDSIISPL